MFLAAENGALPRGKVGGLADVVRDLPVALASRGTTVSVVTPAYGIFTSLSGATRCGQVDVPFAGTRSPVGIFRIPGQQANIEHFVLDHARFAPREPGEIYCHDSDDGPFATDATKFAFFCRAAAAAVVRGQLSRPDVIHLHDWPAGLLLFLRRFAPEYADLKKIRTVLTIHNLAMQGVRPLRGYASSLESWFPDVSYANGIVVDPRWKDCVNPLAVGIRLADAVNTVSPSYAREILEPADPARGFGGGEGLEKMLGMADRAGRLAGILNGCTYPTKQTRKPSWPRVLETLRTQLARWIAQSTHVAPAHYIADKRLADLSKKRPRVILTSIGRIVEQKVRLFREPTPAGVSALDEILELLGSKGLFIMVGSGDEEYERFLSDVLARNERFVFLRGYSDPIAEQLYAVGDLFLMPSTFEPCGISQMLAMRAGQPCVVHGVGGLCDTVTDNVDGFVFGGTGLPDQARAFVSRVSDALDLKVGAAEQWKEIQQAAAGARFSWDEAAARYEEIVYGFPGR